MRKNTLIILVVSLLLSMIAVAPAMAQDPANDEPLTGTLSEDENGDLILTTEEGDTVVIAPSGAFSPGLLEGGVTVTVAGEYTADGTLKVSELTVVAEDEEDASGDSSEDGDDSGDAAADDGESDDECADEDDADVDADADSDDAEGDADSDDEPIVGKISLEDDVVMFTSEDGESFEVAPSSAFSPGQLDLDETYVIDGEFNNDDVFKAASLEVYVEETEEESADEAAEEDDAAATEDDAEATEDDADDDGCDEDEESDGEKVYVCHYPGGDKDKGKTLHIGASAEPAHLAHGDDPGQCENEREKGKPDKAEKGTKSNGNGGGKGKGNK